MTGSDRGWNSQAGNPAGSHPVPQKLKRRGRPSGLWPRGLDGACGRIFFGAGGRRGRLKSGTESNGEGPAKLHIYLATLKTRLSYANVRQAVECQVRLSRSANKPGMAGGNKISVSHGYPAGLVDPTRRKWKVAIRQIPERKVFNLSGREERLRNSAKDKWPHDGC